jgi:hypothetical protein
VSCNFEEVRALSRVRNKYAAEKVSGVGCDIFGECEWCRNYVFIKEVDIIAFGIGWVIVER